MLLWRASERRHGRKAGYRYREMDWAKRTLSALGSGKGNRAAKASEREEGRRGTGREWPGGYSAERSRDFSAEVRIGCHGIGVGFA